MSQVCQRVYHSRLQALSDALKNSLFFRTHEVIGSSLLFVHNHTSGASVWMIDFGKTTPVPDTYKLLHNILWTEGSRENGYLIGLTSFITFLSQAVQPPGSRRAAAEKKRVLNEIHLNNTLEETTEEDVF